MDDPHQRLPPFTKTGPTAMPSAVIQAEQSNTSINYGDLFVLKLLRKAEEGVNLDLELGRFLTEKTDFTHIAPVAGAMEYRRERQEPVTMGILHGFVPNQGDAWKYTLDVMHHYYETALTSQAGVQPETRLGQPWTALAREEPPALAGEMIGAYLESARLLGERTAQMHLALASHYEESSFAPVPFTGLYQRSIYQSMRNLTSRIFHLLRSHFRYLPEEVRPVATEVLDREEEVFKRLHSVVEGKITGMRIRIHGDFHLGQVLYTGKDFIIIDFEGEPARALSERRLKRSALNDGPVCCGPSTTPPIMPSWPRTCARRIWRSWRNGLISGRYGCPPPTSGSISRWPVRGASCLSRRRNSRFCWAP